MDSDEPPEYNQIISRSLTLETQKKKYPLILNELFQLNLGRVHFHLEHDTKENSFSFVLFSQTNSETELLDAEDKIKKMFYTINNDEKNKWWPW